MSYLTCTNCGQKAPDTATKCQQCGRAFGRPPQRPGDSSSRRSSFPAFALLAGALLIGLAAYQFWPGPGSAPSTTPAATPPETTTVAAQPPSAPAPASKESRAAPADSIGAGAVPPPSPTRSAEQSRPPAADTTQPAAPAAPPEPVTIDVAHQRIAQVFANLRAEPSNTSAVVRVLQPGEVVSIDSLQQGWYRVVADSQAVGYVAQQYLDTLPPR